MKTIAYFAAEYAIADDLPTYAGGLGVLAADIVRQVGDEGRDFIAFGMAYRHNVAMKRTAETPIAHDLEANGFNRLVVDGQPLVVSVDFGDWSLAVAAWERKSGDHARLIFLDTDLEQNKPLDRNLTANLYDPDTRTRLLQQFILAAGAREVLRALDISPDVYHMNEGHMAFVGVVLGLEYAKDHEVDLAAAFAANKPRIVASKHTILAGAGDFADRDTVVSLFDAYCRRFGCSAEEIFALGAMDERPELLSTTKLMLAAASRGTAVSRLHAEAEKHDHPQSMLFAVTNGVHQPTWQHPDLSPAERGTTAGELWRRHEAKRRELINYTNQQLGTELSADRLTIVWARRFASYKRPLLIFSDFDRLTSLLQNSERPVQLIISGNANESDAEGMKVLEAVTATSQHADLRGHFAYLPHYATATTKVLAAGADVWLNTPIRGFEACGTSGMKAGLNGAVHVSTSDGWIEEVDVSKIGWELPVENSDTALYDLLEQEVAPLFYNRDAEGLPTGWVAKMQASIDCVESGYTAATMMKNYYDNLYQ